MLYLTGKRIDPDTVHWAQNLLNVLVVDHWWQTKTGWTVASNPLDTKPLPVKMSRPSIAMPDYDIQIFDQTRNPSPPSTFPNLWDAEERFLKSYLSTFPGYYETGDAGSRDKDEYLYVMARTVYVINIAGHRLSTGAMEEVLANYLDVANVQSSG